jgi:hypothetical protein
VTLVVGVVDIQDAFWVAMKNREAGVPPLGGSPFIVPLECARSPKKI